MEHCNAEETRAASQAEAAAARETGSTHSARLVAWWGTWEPEDYGHLWVDLGGEG